MRQWQVPPECLCDKHLLGEHVEHHMMLGHLAKFRSVDRYLSGLFDPSILVERHAELVLELSSRGMNHKSPLDQDQLNKVCLPKGYVDIEESYRELSRRCLWCRVRIQRFLSSSIQSKGE